MHFESTNIFPGIDPRLQRLIERKHRGLTTAPTASTDEGEVAVIAKVSDIDAWHAMSEVLEGAEIGQAPTGEHIVTARVPVARLESIRRAPFIISLKASQRLRPQVTAINEDPVNPDLVPLRISGQQGRGVIVGIIDLGCDFAHKNFRHQDGSTRLLTLWDQNGQSSPDSPCGYGKVYSQDEINLALQAADPYEALGYGPATDTLWDKGAHGTHVMDIAAGNGNGTDIPGVAPEADLVFVHLDYLTSSLDNSITLVEAIHYIFELAGDRPCVINISLGTNTGPHDGTNLVEQGIDALVSQQPNRAVVIAAGNSYNDGIHAAGAVPSDGYVDLKWEFPASNWTHNEMELWYCGEDEFRLELLSPDDHSLGYVDLGGNARVPDQEGNTSIYVAHRQHDPENGDNVISILMASNLPSGVWTIRLHGVRVRDGNFHAWIERDDVNPSRFLPPYDNSHTLGSLSCGHYSIVVGSYNNNKPSRPLSWFSSSGPTRDGRQKPEVSAPGEHIWAAHSRTGYASVRKSGTSMAAPVVAGMIALLLAEARSQHVDLTIDQIRDILVQMATRSEFGDEWNERYGYGCIDRPVLP